MHMLGSLHASLTYFHVLLMTESRVNTSLETYIKACSLPVTPAAKLSKALILLMSVDCLLLFKLCGKFVFCSIFTNSKDTDEMQHNAAIYQGLHCL